MSEDIKRLLKCDFRYTMQNMKQIVISIVGLLLWFAFLFEKVVDVYLLLIMFMGIIMITLSIADWQYRNSLYVSMGVRRKNLHKVIMIRGIMLSMIGLVLEVILASIFYTRGLNIEILLISLGFFLICHGYGQFTGTLVYQKKKIGTVLQFMGIMAVSGCSGFFAVVSMEENLPVIATMVQIPHVIIVMVLAVMMWSFGMYCVHKQMKNFAVL